MFFKKEIVRKNGKEYEVLSRGVVLKHFMPVWAGMFLVVFVLIYVGKTNWLVFVAFIALTLAILLLQGAIWGAVLKIIYAHVKGKEVIEKKDEKGTIYEYWIER